MRIGKKSSKREKKAMSVSLYANLMFVVVELVMAIVTGSQAVLLDGVYDGIEFVMLLPSIFLIPLLYKPSNEKYPFGHMQMETVFIVVKGITMITVTVGLITNSINILFHGGRTVDFGVVAWLCSWHNSDILSEEEKQSDEFPSYYSRDAGVEDG